MRRVTTDGARQICGSWRSRFDSTDAGPVAVGGSTGGSRYLRRYPSIRRSRWDRKTGLFGSVSALGLPVVMETYARFEKSIVLVALLFNVLVTSFPKELSADVGAIRGTASNLAASVGTVVIGALVVGVLSTGS